MPPKQGDPTEGPDIPDYRKRSPERITSKPLSSLSVLCDGRSRCFRQGEKSTGLAPSITRRCCWTIAEVKSRWTVCRLTESLDEIVRRVVDVAHPNRIIMLGSAVPPICLWRPFPCSTLASYTEGA
ncbi:MAG: hypothetical protein OJF50_001438 [Nitrospira sp.]|nr:hypothetical protein [Nitrospira sp.]